MIRTSPSYSLDNSFQYKFQKKQTCKPIFQIKSLNNKRNTRPKSYEATDSDQQNFSCIQGPSRRKSCYCNQCGCMGKKQLQFMDLKLCKQQHKLVNKRSQCNIDRRCTLNIQNRSVFYRRNTQKNSDKFDNLKSPTQDQGDSKSSGWFIRQMVMRKSTINIQKLVENSHSKYSNQQSNKKIDDLFSPKSQQTIHIPMSTRTVYQKCCNDSPCVRIRTIAGFDCENNVNSPNHRDIPKLSPYLSFRQINFNLLVPLKLKSYSSSRKTNKRTFFHSKVQN